MTKRRLIIMLAAVAMAMAVMAPASAGRGGVSNVSLAENGWSCFSNAFDTPPGFGYHCTKNPITEFLDGGHGAINVMVFADNRGNSGEPVTAGEFIGTEILRFSDKDIAGRNCGKGATWTLLGGTLFACHHWHGGSPPA